MSRLARGLAADLHDATPRDRHTLVVKRLETTNPTVVARRLRTTLTGTSPLAAAVTSVDIFDDPQTGRGPLAYLRVESPGLETLHETLCETFSPIEGIEGPAYIPHITIARGGDVDQLQHRNVDIEWTIDSLVLWSANHNEPVERIALSA